MTYQMRSFLVPAVTLAVGLTALTAAHAQKFELNSPNGQVTMALETTPEGNLSYRVLSQGQPVVLPSALGILLDGQNLGQKVTYAKPVQRSIREKYKTFGAHTEAKNECQEATISVTSGTTKWVLELRAYNDGVAYRYRVPGTGTHHVDGEVSGWNLPAGSSLFYQDDRNRSYEAPYEKADAGAIPADTTLAAPAAVKLPGNLGYALLSEANLVNYSDMALKATTPGMFAAIFPNNSGGWNTSGEIVSPWRVTLIAPDLNTLVNSNLIENLCPAPDKDLAGAKWIKPGRANWHWLITYGPKFKDQHQWVDWTKDLGFEYYLIDDGWKRWNDGGNDAWTNLKSVVDYAKTKNVGIWAWVNSEEVFTPEQRKAYLEKAKAAGVVGLKIDFPHPADVEWVNWYDATLQDMAKYHLMVDFHGAVKPTGRQRTYPNELTREAIRGRENGKQSALHDTTLPFLRYVQGPADFTPGELRVDKLKESSWGHELAQAIVYTSPFLCYGGGPQDFLANPARDIIKAIPATWDETVVLPGSEIGEMAIFARRKGSDWFIGVLGGADARTITIDLSFLGKGDYTAQQFADAMDRPDGWKQSTDTVNKGSKLTINLRPNGGYVARLTKKR